MPNTNSQEQTIYRNLAGQIQLGFYDNGERFPSAQEIAQRFFVSYCPAQRALKMLEKSGFIELCRGKATVVIAKPYKDYLGSEVFKRRIHLLADLTEALELISPSICFQGICHMKDVSPDGSADASETGGSSGKQLYHIFNQALLALGSRMILSLYYDVGSYVESAYLDILGSMCGKQEMDSLLHEITAQLSQYMNCCQEGQLSSAKQQHERLGAMFFDKIKCYFEHETSGADMKNQEAFSWGVRKGRTRYCDIVAIDMICKINQGIYPLDELLPNVEVLADVYHVSSITMRRTIGLLNKLGVVKTINGIGSRVVYRGDSTMPSKLRDFMLDDNLKTFLEALQLLIITCEKVLSYTYPYITEDLSAAIVKALSIKDQQRALVTTLSACIQAIVRCCPLESIREIYRNITLLLLNGSILRLNTTGEEAVSNWADISAAMLACQKNGDAEGFSRCFRQLAEDSFIMTKQTLLEIGVRGVQEVVIPL